MISTQAAAADDFDEALRPHLAKALAPHTARIAKQLSQGARLERVAASQVLRALARCPDANGALCDACLDACADALFTHPHADVLHVHCADVLLAIIDRKPLHAHAAKRRMAAELGKEVAGKQNTTFSLCH